MCLRTIVSKQHIKMFVFTKKEFYVGSLFLSSLVSKTSLNCISMKNQECKVRSEIIMLIVINLYFILLVLKQVNVVAIVIILIIHMQKDVFLMLYKI